MPLIDVRCTNCANITENIELNELDNFRCRCGGLTRRLYQTCPFILKGEGWSKQDYETPNKDVLKEHGDGTKFTPDNKPFEKSLF